MPNPYCVFGGESIESRDGESLEGVSETRLSTGTIFTDKLFTGQREMAGLGIYHYNARFYSPKLGRFLSPDTIVPGYANPQNLNRFSYVTNNPLRYTDPTGHMQVNDGYSCHACTPTPPLSGGGGGGGGGGNGGNGGGNGGGGQPSPGPNPSDGEPVEPNLGGGHPLASPEPDDIKWCGWFDFDCALSSVSLIATVVAAVPGTIGLVGLGVDLVATFWAIGRTNEDYRQGEISQTRKYALNTTGLVGLLPGGLIGEWAFPVSFVTGLANLLMTATGLPN